MVALTNSRKRIFMKNFMSRLLSLIVIMPFIVSPCYSMENAIYKTDVANVTMSINAESLKVLPLLSRRIIIDLLLLVELKANWEQKIENAEILQQVIIPDVIWNLQLQPQNASISETIWEKIVSAYHIVDDFKDTIMGKINPSPITLDGLLLLNRQRSQEREEQKAITIREELVAKLFPIWYSLLKDQ